MPFYRVAVKLFDSLSQFFAWLELCNLLCRNLNLVTVRRVNALASRLFNYRESTETYELNTLTLNKGILNSSDSCINSFL